MISIFLIARIDQILPNLWRVLLFLRSAELNFIQNASGGDPTAQNGMCLIIFQNLTVGGGRDSFRGVVKTRLVK